jgi:uroporphyrinogen-III synthase
MTTAILTRPANRISQTAEVYQTAGMDVFQSPVFAIKPNPMVRPEWLLMPADTWVILSVHALRCARQLAPALKPTASTRVIAVGPAVAKAWQQAFEHPVEYHPSMNSEGVIALLQQPSGQAVKILTNRDGRGLVKQHCMSAGISYQQINVYERHRCPLDIKALEQLYSAEVPVLTATSADILQVLVAQLPATVLERARQAPLVVGARRIATVASSLGFLHISEADSPADEAMCAAVQDLTA